MENQKGKKVTARKSKSTGRESTKTKAAVAKVAKNGNQPRSGRSRK